MKNYTKYLKDISKRDHIAITQRNNSKDNQRSDSQRIQALHDKKAFYTRKYTDLLGDCTTPAQKRICRNMLDLIEKNCIAQRGAYHGLIYN